MDAKQTYSLPFLRAALGDDPQSADTADDTGAPGTTRDDKAQAAGRPPPLVVWTQWWTALL